MGKMPDYPDWFVTWMQENTEQFQPTEMSEEQPQHMVKYQFTGGINTDSAPDQLADEELRVADNIVINTRGAISKRPGGSLVVNRVAGVAGDDYIDKKEVNTKSYSLIPSFWGYVKYFHKTVSTSVHAPHLQSSEAIINVVSKTVTSETISPSVHTG